METFESIYRKNYGWVKNYLTQRLNGDKETAEDLTCTTFVKLSKHLPSFDPTKSSLNTYINNIMRTALIDYFRSKGYNMKIRSTNIENFVDSEGNEFYQTVSTVKTDSDLEVSELTILINKTIDSFKNENQKEVYRLRIFAELSFDEISEKLGIPESTAKVYMFRLREKLKSIAV